MGGNYRRVDHDRWYSWPVGTGNRDMLGKCEGKRSLGKRRLDGNVMLKRTLKE